MAVAWARTRPSHSLSPCRRSGWRQRHPTLPPPRAADSPSTAAARHNLPSTPAALPPDDPPWLCPVCGGPLTPSAPSTSTPRLPPLTCPAGHSHDRAKEGHVFLLPTGRKRREAAGPPGDAEAQVRARRAFFDGGFYDGITRAAADAVAVALTGGGGGKGGKEGRDHHPLAILDAGCGEGAYVGALGSRLPPPTASLLGVDVSKPAIRLASARHKAVARFAVASSFALPVGQGSLDAVLVAMAPLPPASELGRVLKPGGVTVVVRPAPRHLDGLKRAVYGDKARFEEEEEEEEAAGGGAAGLPLLARERVTYALALPGPAAAALLTMTPFLFSAGRGVAEAWAGDAGARLETAVDVWVETFGPPGG